jgi:hypothetical protein
MDHLANEAEMKGGLLAWVDGPLANALGVLHASA